MNLPSSFGLKKLVQFTERCGKCEGTPLVNVCSSKVKHNTGREWKTINQSVVCKSRKEQVLIVEPKNMYPTNNL